MTDQLATVTNYESTRGTRLDRMRKREQARWVGLGFEGGEANDHVKRCINLRVLAAIEAGASLHDIACHFEVTIERVRQMARAGRKHSGFLGSFMAALVPVCK